jgi:quinol monooxygenase YgiN
MALVSITRLRLRSWRFVPGFIWHAFRSRRQARAAPGNLDAAVLNEAHRTFWTCTVWRDEAAMLAFMRSGAHRRAMSHLPHWCDEAAVARWQQDITVLPDWLTVHHRMTAEGRRSQVKHPSPAHERFEIAPPRL